MAWNRPSDTKVEGKGGQRNIHLRGLIAGAMVVLGAGIAAWLIWPEGERTDETPSPQVRRRIREATPAVAPATAVVAKVEAPAPKPAETGNVTIVRQTVQMRTLEDGTQVPIGRNYFTNHIERALSTLCNPGGMAIPLSAALRRFSDEEIMRILRQPMEYDKNDEKFIRMRKMEMQRIKNDILAYIDEGHTVREALKEADKTIRRDSSYLMMTRKHMTDALKTGDGEVIRAYAKKLNEDLEARGMRPLEVPKQYRIEDAVEEGDQQ